MKDSASKHNAGGKARPRWPADSEVTAVFSKSGRYRYELAEIWDPSKPLVLWVLMNPSVACMEYSDPTLRKTGKFARAWGFGGQLVGNVHAYRATDKRRLLGVGDPVGPGNDKALLRMAAKAKKVVLAFGQPPKPLRARGLKVVALLKHHKALCHLKLAKDGTPCHPLYLPETLLPQPHRVKA